MAQFLIFTWHVFICLLFLFHTVLIAEKSSRSRRPGGFERGQENSQNHRPHPPPLLYLRAEVSLKVYMQSVWCAEPGLALLRYIYP